MALPSPPGPAHRALALARTPGAIASLGAVALVAATLATLAGPPPGPSAAQRVATVAPSGVDRHAAPAGAAAEPRSQAREAAPDAARIAPSRPRPARADFAGAPARRPVRHVADWALASDDAGGLPFMIIDKVGARLYAFGADGRARGSTPVLLGLARGDASVPGIGERPLARIRPHERTTPAGRFVAEPGRNLRGEDIVWIDYDAAVSMHRVRATHPRERRLQRLASPTVADNRISYGCVNVPASFYDGVVRPLLARGRAVVYVLPERRPLHAVFGPMQGTPQDGARAGSVALAEPPTAGRLGAR